MENIKISNFRKIQDTWDLDLAPITFFTGTNNSGKSTIFKALMLLEDYVKSSNHFQLDFKGPNSKKHRIHSYKNAVNGFMLNDSNWNLNFTYHNMGHAISLKFQPLGFEDGNVNKGKLKFIEIIREQDGSKLSIENTGGNEYVVRLDVGFLETDLNEKIEDELVETNNLILSIENQIQMNTKGLEVLQSTKKKVESNLQKKPLQAPNSGLKESFETWLRARTKQGSGRNSSYIKALELISDKTNNNIFKNYVVDEIIELYNDVLVEQKVIGGKYYDIKAPSYGMSGFYSAALKKYIEFLKDRRISVVERRVKRRLDEQSNNEIMKSYDYTNLSRMILDTNFKIENDKKKLLNLKQKIKSLNRPKNKDQIVLMPEFSLDDYSEDFYSIDVILREIIPDYMLENPKKVGKIDGNTEMKKAYEFGDTILQVLRFSIDHLGPHRHTQNHLYINNDSTSDINDLINEHSIRPISKTSQSGKFVKKWMQEFDIGEDFKIRSIEGIASQIEIMSSGQKLNLADKGFGAGQIFAVLLKIALEIQKQKKDTRDLKDSLIGFPTTIIVIEEPEANLHPALQSKLADLFYLANKEYGIRFILETHSEYIIRQSQVLNIKTKNSNIFNLFYFQKNGRPYQMNYLDDGKFDKPFGSGFFNVADELAVDIFKANKSKK